MRAVTFAKIVFFKKEKMFADVDGGYTDYLSEACKYSTDAIDDVIRGEYDNPEDVEIWKVRIITETVGQ